jgi:streptomycin 6-kinase
VEDRPRLTPPPALDWLRDRDDGRAWLAALPGIVASVARTWDLALGAPMPRGLVSCVMPATLRDGSHAVLKVQFPDRECEHEAAALTRWAGEGAIRLLAHDPERHALLLERCEPGWPLSEAPDEALDVLVGLLPRLWIPAAAPFRPLAEEAAWWAGSLVAAWERAGRPFDRRLVDAALDWLAVLPGSGGEHVLLHQDLHADNVLRAGRERWLAIDPKPLAGEREFGAAPIVRSFELGHSKRAVRYRLDRLTGELGLDRQRARGWTIAQTVAWSCSENSLSQHIETAGWLLEA